ncbi:type VI secretion system protein TssA [Azospirillum doebereinerae]|uniref:Type VI secretion system protein TssA n=1 Tax=Azospirillum doebereinerae TaxID=92933 RepID=A0A3S0XR54_9PROT|nr:type VI secretion system protein TssA [Azospirillum doebereinerae]MCG5240227.1 type VI secretion system protein TssA [Azospirillum doebereinerae]RUQ75869.1 type VI secretion system protein TssA [Azospirillum doebereinerae]
MPTPQLFDIEELLAAIEGDPDTGIDLRENASTDYYAVKDARSAARAAERSMDVEDDTGALLPEWRTILDVSPLILRTQAKDLEVTAWFIEALLRAQGFAGLRDGFALARGLVEKFWDNLYPAPDEDGIETRVGPLTGLNGESADGTLIQPIRKVPLTLGDTPYALWHYEQAIELSKITDENRRQARIDNGAVTWEQFEQSVRETPASEFRTLVEDIQGAIDEFEALGKALYDKAGYDAPPAGNIRNVLSAALDAVNYAARDRLATLTDDAPLAEAAAGPSGGDGGAAGGAVAATAKAAIGGVVTTRDDAFRALLQIADFFRKTEPHSPMSYTLEEVVRRGRMTLPELLQELITDEETRRLFFVASGAKAPPPAEQSGY